jgi:hypothetical protein
MECYYNELSQLLYVLRDVPERHKVLFWTGSLYSQQNPRQSQGNCVGNGGKGRK